MLKYTKQLLKNYIGLVTMFLGVVCMFILFSKTGYIKSFFELNSSEHFSILSIASLLGGFVFTGLGIIVSGVSTERIERLNNYGYMDKYYHEIYLALFCNITTVIAAIILISCSELVSEAILYWIVTIEQLMLYESIALFIKCMFSLNKIINKIRKN